ncbi:hypothetical protein DVH05_028095 [Phytophthora capsici]|nr:hypothetical protein DVH05_028095 [Phytophthora capsici]
MAGSYMPIQQKLQVDRSRYDVLAGDDEEDDETAPELPGPASPPSAPIEIQTDDELEEKAPVQLTEADKAKLHLVKAKPPKVPSTPQLVALKSRERKVLRHAVNAAQQPLGKRMPPPAYSGEVLESFSAIEASLGLRQVNTPATGNCMAMALAQALVDTDLASQDDSLEAITKSLKQGICWAGQQNLQEQFDHYVRTSTLVNVQRGWDGMPSHESTKQFKWYLEEYARSPSSRESIVPQYNWGCSELMTMASNETSTFSRTIQTTRSSGTVQCTNRARQSEGPRHTKLGSTFLCKWGDAPPLYERRRYGIQLHLSSSGTGANITRRSFTRENP